MKKKQIIIIIGALFLAVLLWRIVVLITKGTSQASNRSARPPVAVEVDSVRYGPIQEMETFVGSVTPIYQYILAPKVSGRVVQIKKRIGDWVKRGEVVARIDDSEYQQAVREAEANLKIAQATLREATSQFALAKQDLERVQSLQEKGIASPAELDAAQTNFTAQKSRLELATAQVDQRDAALKSAKIRLGYTTLMATEPGFIGERYVDVGSLLAPNAPVVSIIGIDTVIVQTTVIERIYGRVQIGQPAEVQVDAYPAKIFIGRVARIAPMLQEASRVAKMEVEVVNDSLLLKPGMFTRVRVVLAEKDTAQLVPGQALVNRAGQNVLFVVPNNQTVAKQQPVQVGITTPEKIEIVAPKIDGLVVTLGQHLLEDGSPVILPGSSPNRPTRKGSKE
ncbi:MAG: efflux RND transporter periplasmic adaptor subunit [candidate division KSB1 bacterium]|nr:efflux RND transporter periplasmic adaptor subunit [candidate division KSB1 bacterium]MDZ7318348.1 efflux RND transporter periplasmic adaptor subunit [candidate division KSB1 bacterium]MDZ7340683.1 efflux RND transporter periplasmic adaptor subunit [candidate division KSB1 bacterium]